MADLALDATDGKVHAGHAPSRIIRFLAEDGDIILCLAGVAIPRRMGLDELDGLNEHPRGAATGVVHPPLIWFKHLHEQSYNTARRVELAALLSFGTGELRKEIFINPAESILGAVLRVADHDIAYEVDQLPEPRFIQGWAGIILRQDAFKSRIIALDCRHSAIDRLADRRLLGLGLEPGPTCFRRHPEDIYRAVLVGILRIGTLGTFGKELGMMLLERVRDILEKDKAKDDMLIFGCVHTATQGVGRSPELGLENQGWRRSFL